MRKYAVVVLLVCLLSLGAFSVIGQEELPQVVLAVEPIRELHEPTLAEAARNNDYVTFDALYREAKARGESVAAYDTLHELWSWSITDPIGAFYGPAMHDRLAAAYPDYAKFIAEQSIVDDHGNVFYPTSETRAFLLSKAIEARAPRVQIAGDGLEPPRPKPTAHRAAKHKPAPAPVAAPPVAAPPVAAPPVVAEPVASAPRPPLSAPAPAPAPVRIAQPAAQPVPLPATTADPDSVFATRGILLLVIGLIGIGVLAVMLRTPRETPQVTILQTEPEKPVAPVESIQRPPAQTQEQPRATGSHG